MGALAINVAPPVEISLVMLDDPLVELTNETIALICQSQKESVALRAELGLGGDFDLGWRRRKPTRQERLGVEAGLLLTMTDDHSPDLRVVKSRADLVLAVLEALDENLSPMSAEDLIDVFHFGEGTLNWIPPPEAEKSRDWAGRRVRQVVAMLAHNSYVNIHVRHRVRR